MKFNIVEITNRECAITSLALADRRRSLEQDLIYWREQFDNPSSFSTPYSVTQEEICAIIHNTEKQIIEIEKLIQKFE